MAAYDIGEAFQRIEEEMIDSMSRNLKRHLNTEEEEGLNYSMWQAEQLAALNNYRKNNKKLFGGYFSTINDKIEEVLRKANESGKMDQEKAILEAIRDGFKVPNRHGANSVRGQFFKINERKMNALINATKKDMAKAETAMLRMADDEYRKIIFNSEVYYNSGAGTLSQSVDMATKDFLSRGITCIEYANGARVSIDAYARMALRTAQTRAYLQGEATKRDEWGINTVIVNRRGVACPRCLKWVAKVYYDDVWGNSPVPSPAKYPRLSEAVAGGLYHPNCKDIHTTYFEGVSSPPKPMTKEEIDEANRVYELEQEQRYNERMIRKYKRLATGSTDPENAAKYQDKLEQWQTRQTEFVGAHSDVLIRRSELEKVFPEPPSLRIDKSTPPKRSSTKHEHTWIEVITKQPTCTEKGEKTLTCVCGEKKKKSIPALGHDWGETENGRKQAICKRCGEKKYSSTPKPEDGNNQTNTAGQGSINDTKSFTELSDYMKKKYGVDISSDVADLDFESVKESCAGIDRVFDEFPAAKKMFTTIDTGKPGQSGIMSAKYSGEISFNPKYYNSRKAALDAHQQNSFHPKGCSPFTSGAHEAGHMLERYLVDQGGGTLKEWGACTFSEDVIKEATDAIRTKQKELGLRPTSKAALVSNVSGYATFSSSECLAEAVADYIQNGDQARALSKEIWNVLKRRIA